MLGNSTSAWRPSTSCSFNRCSGGPTPAVSSTVAPKGCHVSLVRPARRSRNGAGEPGLPSHYRTPEGWREAGRQEGGSDEGVGAARRHRKGLVTWFARARRVLDDFAPDFVVVWGDDQYENFKEDIIPPFCVLAYDA